MYGSQTGTATPTGTYALIEAEVAPHPTAYNYYLSATDSDRTTADAFLYSGASVSWGGIGTYDGLGAGNCATGPYGNVLPDYVYQNASSQTVTVPITGQIKTDVSGTLIGYYKLVWQGGGIAPPYPDHVTLQLQTKLVAYCDVYYLSSGLTSGLSAKATASDSFGESVTASASQPDPGYTYCNTQSSPFTSSHLIQAAVDRITGVATVSVGGRSQNDAANSIPYHIGTTVYGGTGADAKAEVTASAKVDDRAVTISADVDVTNKKVPDVDAFGYESRDANGDLNYKAVANTPDADGTMNGDTIYSYHSLSYVTAGSTGGRRLVDFPVINWREFTPSYTGNWHYKQGTTHDGDSVVVPDVVAPDTWSWSPGESEDTWDYAECSMPLARHYSVTDGQPTGHDAPQRYPVSYSATDNTDKASATANYNMTVHDPIENNYPGHVSSDFVNPRQISQNLISSGPQDQLGGGTAIQVAYSLSVSFSGPVASWVATTLGLNVTGTYERDYQTTSTTSTTGLPAGWYTYVVEYDHYYNHVGKTDAWGVAGYVGTAPYAIREIPKVEADCVGLEMAPPQQGSVGGMGH